MTITSDRGSIGDGIDSFEYLKPHAVPLRDAESLGNQVDVLMGRHRDACDPFHDRCFLDALRMEGIDETILLQTYDDILRTRSELAVRMRRCFGFDNDDVSIQ